MVSLWNKKDNGEEEHQEDQPDGRTNEHQQEPDERTRLLQQDNNGYLSPDDPAVSTSSLGHDSSGDRRLTLFAILGLSV